MSQWAYLYNSRSWRARRSALLATEPLCRLCVARGRITPATVADHIRPHRGDPHAFAHGELQPLCATCHSSAKQAHEVSGAPLRGGDTTGRPTDPDHHWHRA